MTTRGLYGEIRANRRRSWLLVIAIGLVLTLLGTFLGSAWGHAGTGFIAAWAIAVTFLTITWYGGPQMTLAATGAREADATRDRVVINVVEEMAVAAGVPRPRIYVIEDSAPNAFATGRDPAHASIAVTRGLVRKLDRDELQGVIAHELAHVRNHDIRYTTLVAVTVGAIALLSDLALRHMWWGGGPRRGRNTGVGAITIVAAMFVAVLAPLSARLLQAAVARRRETLADLSAAEMTRYPEALARALIKIDADQDVLEVANRATAPLFITDPIKQFEKRARGWLRTHPPTEDRVRLLRSLVLGARRDSAN